LAALPEGDAKDILLKAGTGLIAHPEDVDCIVRILQEQYKAWLQKKQTVVSDQDFVSSFERRRLTERLAEHIKMLGR